VPEHVGEAVDEGVNWNSFSAPPASKKNGSLRQPAKNRYAHSFVTRASEPIDTGAFSTTTSPSSPRCSATSTRCTGRATAPDAHHVAVEFVHPVIVGKRALRRPQWRQRRRGIATIAFVGYHGGRIAHERLAGSGRRHPL